MCIFAKTLLKLDKLQVDPSCKLTQICRKHLQIEFTNNRWKQYKRERRKMRGRKSRSL